MKFAATVVSLWALLLMWAAYAHDPTDTLMDGESTNSGYLPNHNMDPAVITGGSFGQIWQYKAAIPAGGAPDQYYAKPLVYTPKALGRQVVLVFSEANRMYIIDAVNGTLIAKRDLSLEGEGPFKVSDLPSCNDIGGTIGITGTPVIDPATDTVYFWAKSYLAPGQSGWQNGAYRFHAVDSATLAERPGFPTNIQGAMADNDNTRWFTGGSHLQRASLNLVNGVVFAGFGGHCDLFNYTGWVVGMSTAGKYVTGYVTSGGPGAPPEDGTWNGGGGAAGIWMAGAAIASDNSGRLFVATGNGKGTRVNNQAPASGHVHLDTLSECIVNLAVNPQNGSLTQGDYFEPYGYLAMDAGDRDLGSGGVVLPDPSVFSGGGVSRLAITCGKNAVCYVANADNLGGYKMGPAGGDAIVQTITPPGGGSMFGNPGTYPLEGGYLYISPVGSPTYVYSLGFDTTGRPAFTLVAQTDDSSPGAVSVGPATVTTLNGQPGTGILWIVDTNGVRAYNAVPVNGKMVKINLPAMPGPLKFQRPAFGNGRYYMTAGNGAILGFGAPVALPLNCTSPVDFGSVNIGSTKTVMVNCTANIAIVQIQGLSMGKSIYQAQNSSLPQGSLKAGDSFSIPVTFNLTGFVLTSNSTSAPAVSPGVQTTAMSLYTTNGATGYSTQQGITLTGVSVSASPFVAITPLQVTFPGIVIGSASTAASTGTFIIQNLGSSDMTILGYAYSADSTDPYTNVTTGASPFVLDENGYFTSQDLPSIGTIIPAGKEVTVHANFNTSTVGDYFTLLTVFSNGGSAYIILTGSANTAPVALLESSTAKGWAGIPDCAVPADGCTTQINMGTFTGANTTLKTIRLTNNGGSNLVITKSKPPVGSVLGATSPNTDFSEGLAVAPGGKTTATVYFQPGQPVLNSPPIVYSGAWTLNTNDLTFGVHVLNFTGTLAPPQVGPLLPNGTARFQYLGCFQDTMGARIEPTEVSNVNNTNGLCQQQAFAANLPFAGTEFQTECWTGSTIPAASLKVADSKCTGYTCPGDTSQLCGGPGGFLSLYYDSQKYNPSTGSFIGGYAPPSAPPHVGAYTYAGCFSDNAGARTLNVGSVGVGSTNSLENCAASCKGYLYFGTEFATQCYCGNKLLNNPIQEPDSQCNKVCPGNSSELCGASSRLTLYVLSNSTNTTTTSTTTTSSSSTTSSSTSLTTSYTNTTITTSTTSSSTISSSSSSVSSTSSASPWSYVGCANDTSAHRALNSAFTSSNDSMTVETCQSFCLGKNYPLAGLEFSTQCFCGLSLGSYSTIGYPGCTMACSGSSTETCGGSSRLSVYNYTNYAYPQLVQDVGTYTLFGCFTDTQGARGLSNSTAASSTSMTVESCVSICQQRGYSKAGVEYGSECYCGNTIANTSTQAPISDCMTKFCTGELTEFCGGSKRLLVYSSDP